MTSTDSHNERKQSDARNLNWLQTAPPCIFSQNSTAVVMPIEKVISKAEETSVFVLSNRSLSHVPNEVYAAASSKLCDTRFLDISKNSLTELGDAICKLPSLVGLNCEKNSIKCVSPDFSKLVHLQFLNLSCNQLTELPDSLTVAVRLKILILRSNNISSVSPTIVRLINLEKLDLSHNELTTLPDEMCCLRNLRCLNLRQNSLRALPEDLGLMHLNELNVSVNRLRSLPLSLIHMKLCLRRLVIKDNPLDAPPVHIALRGKTHVLNYLARQQRNERIKTGLGLYSSSSSSATSHPMGMGSVAAPPQGSFTFTPLASALKHASRDSGYQTSDSNSHSDTQSQSSRRPLSSRSNSDKFRPPAGPNGASSPGHSSTPSKGSRSSSFCNGAGDKVAGVPSWTDNGNQSLMRSNTAESGVPQKNGGGYPTRPLDFSSSIPAAGQSHSPENSSADALTPTAPSALQDDPMEEYMTSSSGSTSFYIGVNRRVSRSPPSREVRRRCENRESLDSTSSTLTDRSSSCSDEQSSSRCRAAKTADSINRGTFSAVNKNNNNPTDDFDVSDFEEFSDTAPNRNNPNSPPHPMEKSGSPEDEYYPSLRRRSNAMGESENSGTLRRKRSSLRNNDNNITAELRNKFMATENSIDDASRTNGNSDHVNNNHPPASVKTATSSSTGSKINSNRRGNLQFQSNLFSPKLTKLEETSNPPENLAAIISHHEHNEQTAETNNNQGDVISNSYDVMSSNDVIISSSDVTINNDVIRKPICDDVMMETSDVMKSNNDVIESTGDMISTNDVTNANFPGKRINGKDGMKGIVESSSRSSCNERDLKGGDNSRNELEKRFADFGNITVRRHAIHLQQDQKILNNIKQAMESMLGVRFGPVDFQEAISDGVHLCHFLNCLNLAHATVDPHKIHPGHLIKNKLQNATLFVDACLNAGLSRNEICTPYDIVEAKNLHIVCRTLQMLLECQP